MRVHLGYKEVLNLPWVDFSWPRVEFWKGSFVCISATALNCPALHTLHTLQQRHALLIKVWHLSCSPNL